jgi:2Fe-2S ferredoxin
MQVIILATEGEGRTVDAAPGTSLMQAAVGAGVDGIAADCGGMLTCGTCHVYVHEDWAARLPPATPEETEMLGFVAAERRPGSRLACQVELTAALDGLTVTLPQRQY